MSVTTLKLCQFALLCVCLIGVTFAYARPEIMFIIDSSKSMREIDQSGDSKLETAKISMAQMLSRLKDTRKNVSLMAYGHRKSVDCNDVEVMVAPGNRDVNALLDPISKLEPKGLTPLTNALKGANKALRDKENAAILLVTDGIESCDGDPCAAVKKIQADNNIDLVVNVVGYKVPASVSGQLECIAKVTAGKYYSADDPWFLARTIQRIVLTGNVRFETEVNVPFDDIESIKIVRFVDEKNAALNPIVQLNKIHGVNVHFWEDVVLPEGEYAAYIKMPKTKSYQLAVDRFGIDGGRSKKVMLKIK